MDGIVFGIANINFQQSLGEIIDENSAPNWIKESSLNMASSDVHLQKSEQVPPSSNSDQNDGQKLDNLCDTVDDDSWEEADDDDTDLANVSTKSDNRNRKSLTFAERRQLPSRASKEASTLGIKRRTIMKPTKSKQKDFNNLKPAEIKKIYMNKKLTNFRPSSLETIFEEPTMTSQNDVEELEHVRLIGARKIRRSLSCSDGYKNNKTLVNKRRAKIKKTFGRRFALKKISLEDFLDKLNSSMEENEVAPIPSDQLTMDEGNTDQLISLSEPQNKLLCTIIDTIASSSPTPTNTINATSL